MKYKKNQGIPKFTKKLLRLPDVIEKTGLGRSSIYQGMIEGTFPKCLNTEGRTVAWLESEIDEWIDFLVAKRDTNNKEDI